MKDPTPAIKTALLTILGSEFTVTGVTCKNYADAPTEAPDEFIWIDTTGFTDVGAKDSFVLECQVDLVIVSRVNVKAPSTLRLDAISNYALNAIVSRGANFTDVQNWFTFFSVKLSGVTNGRDVIDNKMEVYKRLQLTMLCQQN